VFGPTDQGRWNRERDKLHNNNNNNNNNNNVNAKVIPLIIGATGTISKSLTQYLSNVRHEIKELQTTATLDTAHILREVLM
jgi:hypothetical protein